MSSGSSGRVMRYHESAVITHCGGYGGLIKAVGALCADGKRRTATPTGNGHLDTFFSIPARVKVGGKTVSGYVTVTTMSGSDVATEDDPVTVKFRAYTYGKNGHLLAEPSNTPEGS